MERFSNLPQSARENLADLGRQMTETDRKIKEVLGISADRKVFFAKNWDDTFRMYEDNELVAIIRLPKEV